LIIDDAFVKFLKLLICVSLCNQKTADETCFCFEPFLQMVCQTDNATKYRLTLVLWSM